MKKIPHGTIGAYTNHYCRCEECRLVWNIYCRLKYHQRKQQAAKQ